MNEFGISLLAYLVNELASRWSCDDRPYRKRLPLAVAPECYIVDALHIPTVCSKDSDYLGVHVLVNEEASLLLERSERISVIFCEFKLFPWHC